MMYLSDKGFVHRDLATRNVFVSHKNICKVYTFQATIYIMYYMAFGIMMIDILEILGCRVI